METIQSQEKLNAPVAFLASRLRLPGNKSLERIRRDLFVLGQGLNREIWVSEYSRPDLNNRPLHEVEVACLEMVKKASHFICILDGSYGSEWNETQVSILEAELFIASLVGKPIKIYKLKPFVEDRRLGGVLDMIRIVNPVAIEEEPRSEEEIRESIEVLVLQESTKMTSSSDVSSFVQYLANSRTLFQTQDAKNLDVRFLNNKIEPLNEKLPDKEFIENLLESARIQTTPAASTRLGMAWIALRHLASAPYTQRKYSEYIELWHTAFKRWGNAASWFGLHGHIFIGRLASLNCMIDIQTIAKESGGFSLPDPVFHSSGPLASEYYSIAKLAKTESLRVNMLNKALYYIYRALEGDHEDTSGLYSVRSSIHLSLYNIEQAVLDKERSLEFRISTNAHPTGIGSNKVSLGFMYFLQGKTSLAEHYLTEGVKHLEEFSIDDNFTSQGLRRIALFYVLTSEHEKATEYIEKAYTLALRNEQVGVLKSIDKIRKLMASHNEAHDRFPPKYIIDNFM